MIRISLKNILSPKAEARGMIESLIRDLGESVFIDDATGQTLLGTKSDAYAKEVPIRNETEIIGWVRGEDRVKLIATVMQAWVQKELERKKLANEVLSLYQELNLIFNFSEELAQTIGQKEIAAIAIAEARRLIKSDLGLLILWDEESGHIEVPAAFGKPIFDESRLNDIPQILESLNPSTGSEIVGDLSSLRGQGLIDSDVQSLIYAALKVKHRVMGAIILGNTDSVQYSAADLKFLVTLALQSASAMESALLYEKNIEEVKAREDAMRRIYEVTNKFVPHEFIGSLGRNVITDIQLGDKVEKIVTVLFTDIRDYTTLSEQMTPEENFSFVCSFNAQMGPIIRAHRGFINQYLGDAIMAIFPQHSSDALHAAIEMQEAVHQLNANRSRSGMPLIRIGVGMHTGPLIMGITGDHERLDAATISDTVNTASRLEGLTKVYGVNILLSEACVNNLTNADEFHFRQLGLIQLKGKFAPVSIYECFNGIDEKDFNKKLSALPFYKEGVFDYFNKSFKEASDKFIRALEIHPEDKTAKLFLGKANLYLDKGIPENWTGVEEMQFK